MKIVQALGIMLLVGVLAGCGGDSDSEPTGPPPPPEADVLVNEGGSWVFCWEAGCRFRGEGRNLGPDCAADTEGTVRFFDASGEQLGPAHSWERSDIVLDPGDEFAWETYIGDEIPLSVVDAAETFKAEAIWTAVRC